MTSRFNTPKCAEHDCREVTGTRIDGAWWCDTHAPLRGADLIRSLTESLSRV